MNAERKNQLSRCVTLMTALAPHIVAGLSVTELARKTGIQVAVVCRDMDSLAAVGWAENSNPAAGPLPQSPSPLPPPAIWHSRPPANGRTISSATLPPEPSG